MVQLSTAEKIRIVLGRIDMTLSALAERTGQSRQNLSQKMERDNFSEKELHAIAEAMGCEYTSVFVLPNGEKL